MNMPTLSSLSSERKKTLTSIIRSLSSDQLHFFECMLVYQSYTPSSTARSPDWYLNSAGKSDTLAQQLADKGLLVLDPATQNYVLADPGLSQVVSREDTDRLNHLISQLESAS